MKNLSCLIIALLLLKAGICQSQSDSLLQKQLTNSFYTSSGLEEMQRIYNELQEKFPEKNTYAITNYDEMKRILALNYLTKGDVDSYKTYTNSIKDKVTLAEFLDNIANHWIYNNKLSNKAERLSALSVTLINEALKYPDRCKPSSYTHKSWIEKLHENKIKFTDTYAYILYKRENFTSALSTLQPIYNKLTSYNTIISEHYSLMLGALGNHKKALTAIEKAIIAGYSSQTIIDELKQDYVAVNGNSNYDKYLDKLKTIINIKIRERLEKAMINEKAPAFKLKNLNGEIVSLQKFQGKILVVDFWATWCAPCIDSFPGLQQALNKFKDNTDVEFLFIDTWENKEDYLQAVNNLIREAKYSFNVLVDERDNSGKQTSVASSFKVNALPTKIVIDKNGHIRFKQEGNPRTPTEIVEEISVMIDLALGDKKQ